MNFKPKKDEELNNFKLFPKGEYDFTVIKAFDEISEAGNEMIKLEIEIYDMTGQKTRVFDYLLESVAYKLKHFCRTAGLLTEYATGSLTADMCRNRSGKAVIAVDVDKKGKYADKNIVKDYCGVAISAEKIAQDEADVPDFMSGVNLPTAPPRDWQKEFEDAPDSGWLDGLWTEFEATCPAGQEIVKMRLIRDRKISEWKDGK